MGTYPRTEVVEVLTGEETVHMHIDYGVVAEGMAGAAVEVPDFDKSLGNIVAGIVGDFGVNKCFEMSWVGKTVVSIAAGDTEFEFEETLNEQAKVVAGMADTTAADNSGLDTVVDTGTLGSVEAVDMDIGPADHIVGEPDSSAVVCSDTLPPPVEPYLQLWRGFYSRTPCLSKPGDSGKRVCGSLRR